MGGGDAVLDGRLSNILVDIDPRAREFFEPNARLAAAADQVCLILVREGDALHRHVEACR